MSTYTATDFYNDELSRLEEKQKTADTIAHSQSRLAELNDSYRKRYAKYVQILMVLVLAYAVYLAIIILQRTFPSISQTVVDLAVTLLIFLVAFYLFSASWELYSRSLMNYDELEIPVFDSSGIDLYELGANGLDGNLNANVACVGEKCCPGFYNILGDNKCYYAPNVNGNTSVNKAAFTTLSLEYEKIDSAYKTLPFDSSDLKREPNSLNVKPLHDISVLTFSDF